MHTLAHPKYLLDLKGLSDAGKNLKLLVHPCSVAALG
jgi:hypothetical protein